MLRISIFLMASVFALAANSATLVTAGGQLMGATAVNVDGTFYDVSFLEGSCNSLFSGCTTHTFQTSTAAALASQALLDQVFIGVYDTTPSLTNGIENTVAAVFTLYNTSAIGFTRMTAWNGISEGQDVVLDQTVAEWVLFKNRDSGDSNFPASETTTWAVWAPSAVPVPAAAWLFGSALLGLGALKRRKT